MPDNELESLKRTFAQCAGTFLHSSPGPWRLEPDRDFPNNLTKVKRVHIIDRNGKNIATIKGEENDIQLIMVAVAVLPDFIRTLGGIIEQVEPEQ